MKRIFIYIALLLFVTAAGAQTQQGYVKTCGRINAHGEYVPGMGVPNATVKAKGVNEVGSDRYGCFSLKLRSNKFSLEQVTKKGYILVDKDILSREYTISPDTFKILLTTPEEQLETELANERRLRRTLNRQLQQREDEIEGLYAAKRMLKAERDSALQRLYASHADNEKLIKDMVERYSRIDFDQLDEFNRQISEYILNGELQKADSVLSSKGDIHSRIKELYDIDKVNAEERSELDERNRNLQKNQSNADRLRKDLADDCYSKFELSKMLHLNDSAAHYIELRAMLDTMNARWQTDAGLFAFDYLAAYGKAMSYYGRALESALKCYGEVHPQTAECYNNIALVYDVTGEYEKALEYYGKSLAIYLSISGEESYGVAAAYNNIAMVRYEQGEYPAALELHREVLKIKQSLFAEGAPEIAVTYNNIAVIYEAQGCYGEALELYRKALDILVAASGDVHPDVSTTYSNIAIVCYAQENYTLALDYYNKALEIDLLLYVPNHPYIALDYDNIALVYKMQGNYREALELHEKSLAIRRLVLGDRHPDVAICYNSIAEIYYQQGDYSSALELFGESLSIRLGVYGGNHP